MSTTLESTTINNNQPSNDHKHSPPAFLDLADSVCLAVMRTVIPLFMPYFGRPRGTVITCRTRPLYVNKYAVSFQSCC